MNPFLQKKSVLLLDNCTIHKSSMLCEVVEAERICSNDRAIDFRILPACERSGLNNADRLSLSGLRKILLKTEAFRPSLYSTRRVGSLLLDEISCDIDVALEADRPNRTDVSSMF